MDLERFAQWLIDVLTPDQEPETDQSLREWYLQTRNYALTGPFLYRSDCQLRVTQSARAGTGAGAFVRSWDRTFIDLGFPIGEIGAKGEAALC
ncbi:MAG: hypothetical protein JJ872_07135 [Marivivens sp.]|nr:hypothetical protein [Marivivens sp.]